MPVAHGIHQKNKRKPKTLGASRCFKIHVGWFGCHHTHRTPSNSVKALHGHHRAAAECGRGRLMRQCSASKCHSIFSESHEAVNGRERKLCIAITPLRERMERYVDGPAALPSSFADHWTLNSNLEGFQSSRHIVTPTSPPSQQCRASKSKQVCWEEFNPPILTHPHTMI